MTQAAFILASGSPYRKQLLRQLGIEFSVRSPGIDETRKDGETAVAAVARLAMEKAAAVAAGTDHEAWILAADQLAYTGDTILGKPRNMDTAMRMLQTLSGQKVHFVTAVCLKAADGSTHNCRSEVMVRYRKLEAAAIERYLELEPEALNCAAAMRSEGYGITLVDEVRDNEPGALIGLPLLSTCGLLRQAGFQYRLK